MREVFAAVGFGVIIGVVVLFCHGEYEKFNGTNLFVSRGEIPGRIAFALLSGTLVTVIFLRLGKKGRNSMICPRCEQTKVDDGIYQCSCGGGFEKLDEMTYASKPRSESVETDSRPAEQSHGSGEFGPDSCSRRSSPAADR